MAFDFGLAQRQQPSFWLLEQYVPKIQACSQHHVVSVSQFTQLQLNAWLQPLANRCQKLGTDLSLHPAPRSSLGNRHEESWVGVREWHTWVTVTDIWLITLCHAFAPYCFDLKSSYLGILKELKAWGCGGEWNTICKVLRTSMFPP